MKKIYIINLYLLGILCCTNYVFAQAASRIDSLKIIYTNPSGGDNIKLICYTWFSQSECDLVDHTIQIQSNKITVMLNYEVGDLFTVCNQVDTFLIPTLNPGNYELLTSLTINDLNEISDTDTVKFTVGNDLGIGNAGNHEDLNIYPNPFLNELQITANSGLNLVNLEIYSTTGNKVKQIKFDPDKKIHVTDLQAGLYFIVLTDNKGNRYKKKMIKNDL